MKRYSTALFTAFTFMVFTGTAASAESVMFTGQLTQIKTLDDNNLEVTVKHKDGVARFNINEATRIQATVTASQIQTGDHVLSDGQGTLLPVLETMNQIPERPQIDAPPQKPDASKPDSMPPQMPAGPPPHEAQTPPEGVQPPPTPPSEDQKEKASGPSKKKPWEIALENAEEPDPSLKPGEGPLSEATIEEIQAAQQVVVVKKVNDIGSDEKLIELQLVNPEGEIEVCRIPPDKLIYRLLKMQELNPDTQVKLEVDKADNKLQIKSVTLI